MHHRHRRGEADLPRDRRGVRSADPDADEIARRDADAPGVAVAVAGAGFPRQRHDVACRAAGDRLRIARQHAPHDPGRARRQQATLPQRLIREVAQLRGVALARKGAIGRHQLIQPRAGSA